MHTDLETRERFREKYRVDSVTGCWVWMASRLGSLGYGSFEADKRTRLAHRVSVEMHRGPIPEGQVVMHLCDNPLCVNPEHLRVGTQRENNLDTLAKGRGSFIRRGSQVFQAKLLPDQVRAIRAMLAEGVSQSEVARRFDVSNSNVNSIALGRTWAWLDAEARA